MRLERRDSVPVAVVAGAPLLAVLAALLLAAGLIGAAGVNPLNAYAEMLRGAFGSRLSITEMLTRATPLILTGLAAAVAFRARLWNIGGEGQFFVGALATAWVGHTVGLPGPAGIALLLACGMAAGALLLAGPAYLRLRFGVDEVVTTLLLNFIVILFVGLMIEGPMRDPLAFGWPQSVPVDGAYRLPDLVPRTRLHTGLLFAILAAGVVWLILARTVFGVETRAAGLNARAAAFAGISLPRTLMGVALLSGALAGSAGAVEVMGVTGGVTTTMSPGFGYAGIVVAMLAALHPAGVVAAAIFVATVFVGADAMARATG
ncbi:MAG: ABC transporter permease, partial [Pseudomonadota bacterium]